MTRYYPRRVAPFGNPRINAWLAAPRGLSQLPHVLLRLLMPRHPPDTLSSLGDISSRPVSPSGSPCGSALGSVVPHYCNSPRRFREFSDSFPALPTKESVGR